MSTEVIVSEKYMEAIALNRSILVNAELAQQSLYEMCKDMKEMRDSKLYKELGYQNFEEYCENEIGIKRRQAYNYIAIAENLPVDFVQSIAQIGTTKLALLAQLDPDDRTELQQSVDVESATVKELKAHISELQEKNNAANEQLSKKDKQFKAAMESKQNELDDFRVGAKRRQDTLLQKIGMLNDKIKELEERPIEHDVVDNSEELESLKKQLAAARTALQEAQRQLAEKPMVQDVLPVEPLQVADNTGTFKAYLSNASDSLKRLYEFMEQHRHDCNMPLFLERTGNIIGFANSELSRLKGE